MDPAVGDRNVTKAGTTRARVSLNSVEEPADIDTVDDESIQRAHWVGTVCVDDDPGGSYPCTLLVAPDKGEMIDLNAETTADGAVVVKNNRTALRDIQQCGAGGIQ